MSFLFDTPLLSVAQIGELAGALDALHTRVQKAIDRLQNDLQSRKIEISKRWGLPPQHAGTDGGQQQISPAEQARWNAVPREDRARFAKDETLATIRLIKETATAELDKYLKEAGAPHEALMAQRPFYSSPVQVLNRVTLGDARRTAFLEQLSYAGPSELAHMAQVAVSSKDNALAAAVVSLLDRMPTKDRPVGPAEVATAMQLDDYLKVREYLKIGDHRLQGIIVLIRTFRQGQSNPISSLGLALTARDIDFTVLDWNEEPPVGSVAAKEVAAPFRNGDDH